MKYSILLLFILISNLIYSQYSPQGIRITYHEYENQKVKDKEGFSITYSDNIVYFPENDSNIKNYTDFSNRQNISIISYEDSLYKSLTSFDSLPKPVLKPTYEIILGYKCLYATFSYFSNNIEVWYTRETEAKGSPYRNYLPDEESLVLKVVINGNHTLIADSIETIKNFKRPQYNGNEAKEITSAEYEELRILSRYSTLKVFSNERINFEGNLVTPVITHDSNKTYRFSKGTVILKKIQIPRDWEFSFVKLSCRSDGDAYDRTGSVFIIPDSEKTLSMMDALQFGLDKIPFFTDNNNETYQGIISTENYDTPVELMRFFTSFGIGHFNKLREINNYPWKDEVVYKQDVSNLIPGDADSLWIGVFIGNYDKGGHIINLDMDFYPFEGIGDNDNWVLPLFYTVNIMEMTSQNYGKLFGNDTLSMQFSIPDSIEDINLLYTSTGHGGWENGDEFNPKLNRILIDDIEVYKVIPWRTDCGTYRLSNPASGNFGNGMSSSDFSRSNWCPATLTPPYVVLLNDLKPGLHTLKIIIDQGEDEGGSFNHWNVSGVLTSEK